MTFTTLQYLGVEKPLADWGISTATRAVSNQSQDHFVCEIPMPADSADPWPYDAFIIIRIQRAPVGSAGVNSAGVPLTGLTSFTGGSVHFVGYRGKPRRVGRGHEEKIQYPFLGCWERFFQRTVFQKLQASYNGTANVADWLDEVVLGLSLNALVGANDTIPGTAATNLMSVTQTIKEIAAWAITQATNLKATQPFQFVDLAANESTGNYLLYTSHQGTLLLPDFIPGYSGSGFADSAAAASIASGAPWGPQNISIALRAPLDAVKGITCAEALRKTVRWLGPAGDIALWMDNTTALSGSPCPTLNVASRDQLPSVSLPYPAVPSVLGVASPLIGPKGPMWASVTDIARLDELIPPAVDLKFVITGVWNGTPYKQTIHDITATLNISGTPTVVEGIGLAGAFYVANSLANTPPTLINHTTANVLLPNGETVTQMAALAYYAQLPDTISATIDMQGPNGTLDVCTFTTIPVNLASPSGGGTALAFWKYLFPEVGADLTSPDFYSGSTVTVVDDNGSAIDTTDTFLYLLTGNTVAKWMLANNETGGAGCQSVRAHISAQFIGTEQNAGVTTGHLQQHPKHATPTLVSLPGGTYTRQNITPGEIIPFGLSGFIYALSIIPHYEGTYTIQEQEITDQCPFGNNLNLTGGRTEWTNMAAQIQSITYDYLAATTSIRFGPGEHLGAKDLADRLRANRGPRWLYQMPGSNVTNDPTQQPGTQFGTDVAGKSPSPGPATKDLQVFPISLADLVTHGSSYTDGQPGVVIDNRGSGQPGYGGISAPNLPTVCLTEGSGGTTGRQIRCTVADLPSGAVAYFQAVQVCVSGSTKTAYVLMTTPA